MSVKLELGFTGASREREQIARDPILYSILAPSVLFPSLHYNQRSRSSFASSFCSLIFELRTWFLRLQVLQLLRDVGQAYDMRLPAVRLALLLPKLYNNEGTFPIGNSYFSTSLSSSMVTLRPLIMISNNVHLGCSYKRSSGS